jgi:hypothetical protein
MPPRHPSDWEGLLDILQSWLFSNNPSVILDTTGNKGDLLTGLGFNSGSEDLTALALRTTSDEAEDFPGVVPSRNYDYGRIESLSISDYLGSLVEMEKERENDQASDEAEDLPLADVVCCWEISNRRQYTDDVEGYLNHLLGYAGRPKFERVLSAFAALQDGGRGVLVLPRGMLVAYESVFEYLEGVRLNAIIDLDSERFGFEEIDPRFEMSVVLVENRPQGDNQSTVRHISVNQFDDRLGALIHSPPDHLHEINLTNYPLDITTVDQQAFLEFLPQVAFNVPHLLPIFRSDEFVPLGELNGVSVRQGIHHALAEEFYFTPGEVEKSGIDLNLFTPILTKDTIGEAGHSITDSDIDQFVLDLRQPIQDIEERALALPEDEVLEEIRKIGHGHAVDYVTSNIPNRNPRTGYWYCPFLSQDEDNFDLVTRELSSDAEWIRVDLASVILDGRCIGITCTDPYVGRGVSQVMQTKGYQRLIEELFDSSFGGVIHYNKYLIDQIPIPSRALSEEFSTQTESIFPPESHRDEVQLTELLYDCVHEESVRNTFERLLEPNDEYAWAWFLSPTEYQEFTQKWESDPEDAKQFVADRLTQENFEHIKRDLERDAIPHERAQIVGELLDEYRNEKNRLFLYGITPQFEGVLVDWAEQQGHRTGETEDGNFVVYVGEDHDETVPKTLSGLLKYYLKDGFGEFLHTHVRESRNEMAHGGIVENDRRQATMFLLCLYALYRRTSLNT